MKNQVSSKEKKNKKRGMIVTFFVHVGVIALCLIPFVSMIEPDKDELDKEKTEILIDFSQTRGIQGLSSSAKPLTAPDPKPRPKPAPTPEVKPEPVVKPNPTPEPKPDPKPDPKPVPKPDIPEEVVTAPDPEPDVPVAAPEVPSKPTVVEEPAAAPEPVKGAQFPPKPDNGNADSAEGEDEAEAAIPGEPGGEVIAGEGEDGGDGLFARKVIFRPNISDLTQEEGKIVVKLCVNRDGRVIDTDYVPKGSTISNQDLIDLAERMAFKYRFDKDYSAPKKQCGQLSFIFKLD